MNQGHHEVKYRQVRNFNSPYHQFDELNENPKTKPLAVKLCITSAGKSGKERN